MVIKITTIGSALKYFRKVSFLRFLVRIFFDLHSRPCDVITRTREQHYKMATCSETNSTARKRGGRYCVAGGPSGASCKNNQHTDGISMHKFPDKEKMKNVHQKWVNFVRRHRPGFTPSQSSVLCSIHFEPECFTTSIEISKSLGMRRILYAHAHPTLDVVGIAVTEERSDRERRQVRLFVTHTRDVCTPINSLLISLIVL